MATDDFRKRRMIALGLRRAHFAEPWQWRVAIEGMGKLAILQDGYHTMFDYLAKNVSFGPVEISPENVEAGNCVFAYPKSAPPATVTMTLRDTSDRQLYHWICAWAKLVANGDGTFNLPHNYLKRLTIYSYGDDAGGSEKELWSDLVYPQKMGEIELSVDGEGFSEFPAVFIQHKSGFHFIQHKST